MKLSVVIVPFVVCFLACSQQEKKNKPAIGITRIKVGHADKCNLLEAYYYLNNITTDSATLASIALLQAKYLIETEKSDPDCDYPVMANVYIYASKEIYTRYEGDWISMCTITPSNPGGDASVKINDQSTQ